MLFAGLIYAWSVMSRPIAAHFDSWSSAQLSLTFTICMAFFCLGGLVSGLLSGKLSVKLKLMISAVLFLAGFAITARMNSLALLYIGYGVMAGLASGFVYNTIVSTITKYFPDKLGLISGILLMGFGMGSFIIGKVYHALTGEGEAFRNSFMAFGVILFVVIFLISFLIKAPTQSEIEEYQAQAKAKAKTKTKGSNAQGATVEAKELTTTQMVKKNSFWLYFIWTTLLSASGLALIAQASPIVLEVNSVVTSGTLSTVVGLISIFGGVGRVLFGGMYDGKGRLKTMWSISVVLVISIIMMTAAMAMGSFVLLIGGYIVMGLAYGGLPPTNSAYVGDFYGKKHYPVNFSVMNLCLLVASFAGTISGALFDASGSYFSTLIFMGAAAIIGIICSVFIKKP